MHGFILYLFLTLICLVDTILFQTKTELNRGLQDKKLWSKINDIGFAGEQKKAVSMSS